MQNMLREQQMLWEQQNLMQNTLNQALSRVTLQPIQTPLELSPSRLQANFAGPSYVDNTFPSVIAPRVDRGKTPLTYPNNIPLGVRTEPTDLRGERLGGQTHNPIQVLDPVPPPRVDPEDIAQVLRVHFGMNPQIVNRPAYQRPFSERIINEHPFPRNYRPPDFHLFSGEDGASTIEHVGHFTAQLGEVGNNSFYKLQLFGLSLTGTVFSWFANLPSGQLQTCENLEAAFHARFFNPLPTVSLTDLLEIRQMPEETAYQFIERIRLMKGRWPTIIEESEMTNLVVRNMHSRLREALTAHDVQDLASLASKVGRLEYLFREKDHNFRRNRVQQMASVDTEIYSLDEEQGNIIEEMAAEIVSGKPYVCSKLKPLSGTEEREQPTFDVSKADEIFDILLADGQIRIPEGQRLATKEEIKGRPYCKWHNSFTHYTNQCTHFRKEIQKAIKAGRFKYVTMGVEHQPFPKVTTAMISLRSSQVVQSDDEEDTKRKERKPKERESNQEVKFKVCETRVAEKWDREDGSFKVELKNKVVVRDRPTRKPYPVQDVWSRNRKFFPIDIDPRFPGMKSHTNS
ncbi:uncharacterized protein LOC127249109 [Andrographis paniculata]|uniref:uncharacterized protein LOC127249109 n=1 Tax=Andrographis paniculata TaxID=175694 RepID=UPI0021E7963A|nr:uncharacterized protein LOC127249109 [Andrographis paniculata]